MGYITEGELHSGLEELGLRANPEHVDSLWQTIMYNDKNKDGKINYEEFRSFAMWRTENLRRTFDLVDADGDGTISAKELQDALHREGLDAPMSKIKAILTSLDDDHDGKVTFEDFRKMYVLSC